MELYRRLAHARDKCSPHAKREICNDRVRVARPGRLKSIRKIFLPLCSIDEIWYIRGLGHLKGKHELLMLIVSHQACHDRTLCPG